MILVTHDLREAAFLADTVHVMSARPGRIVTTGQVELPRPRDLEVCFEPAFIDLIHELRGRIAEERFRLDFLLVPENSFGSSNTGQRFVALGKSRILAPDLLLISNFTPGGRKANPPAARSFPFTEQEPSTM